MTSCVDGVCGTGGVGLPKPGDPSSDGALQARGLPGGIELSWTLPSTNGFAVAHTIVYRSISNQFVNAVRLVTWGGTEYFDRVAHGTQYWYWVQFVSVQGTILEPIGPASATAFDSVAQMIEELTGRIDSGVLAQELRKEIERIQTISADLVKEIQDRIANNQALADMLAEAETNNGQLVTVIQDEIIQRRDGDATLVESIESLGVAQNDNAALITEERRLRIDADSALSEKIDLTYAQSSRDISAAVEIVTKAYADADTALAGTVASTYATKDGMTAAIKSETDARVGADGALASRIDNLEAGSGVDGTARAAIQEEATARVNADSALASRITTLEASVGNQEGIDPVARAAVQDLANVVAREDSVLATRILQSESYLDGNIVQVRQNLTTRINWGEEQIANIGALYTVKLNVNGLIGGFGAYNDGQTVEAGFDVDRFWVGRTNADKKKPFIIHNGVTYIDQAFIRELNVDRITSGNMNAEWRLLGGNARIIMNNGTVMKVMGNGFGAQGNLLSWFGPSMEVWQCSTANAINYETTSGDAYWGGSLRAGVLYNAQQTTSIAYNASVPLGPFWSNGNPRSIVVSYKYDYDLQNRNMGWEGYRVEGGQPYATIQLWAGNTLLQERTFYGNASVNNEPDGTDSAQVDISGSFTFTHTGGAGNYEYRAVIVNRYQPNLIHGTGSSTSQSVRQTLGIVSTEQ